MTVSFSSLRLVRKGHEISDEVEQGKKRLEEELASLVQPDDHIKQLQLAKREVQKLIFTTSLLSTIKCNRFTCFKKIHYDGTP